MVESVASQICPDASRIFFIQYTREGTVVDADDLMQEMIHTARETSRELGKLEGYSEAEAEDVYRKVALGALKYFPWHSESPRCIL